MTTTKQKRAARYVQIGTVSVDSGMVMIVDPCRARENENHIDEKTGLQHGPGKVDYEKAINLCFMGTERFRIIKEKDENGKIVVKRETFNPLDELTPEDHRQIGYGAVCSTVRGDGEYPVYAVYEGDTLVGMQVQFQ